MVNFNSRDEALELVENGVVTAEQMLTMALKYMSTDLSLIHISEPTRPY